MLGFSCLYSLIFVTTFGVATLGLLPPMTPGLMDPVSKYLDRGEKWFFFLLYYNNAVALQSSNAATDRTSSNINAELHTRKQDTFTTKGLHNKPASRMANAYQRILTQLTATNNALLSCLSKLVSCESYLPRILLTQPCEIRSWRLMSHRRAPLCESSTIFRRMGSGSGRPLTNSPPSWLTPPWPFEPFPISEVVASITGCSTSFEGCSRRAISDWGWLLVRGSCKFLHQ